jgi:hypothetical protein
MEGMVGALSRSTAYQNMAADIPAFVLEAQPATMEAFLAELDRRWGGAADYLQAHGATDDALDRWRDLLLEPADGVSSALG